MQILLCLVFLSELERFYIMMEQNVGIVLEGGAMRNVFSAGVLDFFLDKKIEIPNILAISAGAYVAMNYVSEQKERVLKSLVEPLEEYKFLGVGAFFKTGTFFDMDYLFDRVPREKSPYHFDKLKNFKGRFITSTVDMLTGEAIYHEGFQEEERFYQIMKVANSLPFAAKVSEVDGRPMLDGGMADAIPIAKALEEGWEKIIVILTRDAAYRKKVRRPLYQKLIAMVYRKYPKFVELVAGRGQKYNDTLEQINALEQEGRAFVFRPSKVTVKTSESDVKTLKEYYKYGYECAKERYEELLEFLRR